MSHSFSIDRNAIALLPVRAPATKVRFLAAVSRLIERQNSVIASWGIIATTRGRKSRFRLVGERPKKTQARALPGMEIRARRVHDLLNASRWCGSAGQLFATAFPG
ncbi:hypothetical protein FMN63_04245 [Stappia sp. BW2]|uniref:hypothetical protein n=1 Tax=Stappia sp. BW2 TaxID=2592622 RepID=UPI0011DECBBF|nr:hypothetical protein [Stappia sp. BW2]TYC78076.1 hypothetical protein FMN63_04245 [Stappia sp. BW2]